MNKETQERFETLIAETGIRLLPKVEEIVVALAASLGEHAKAAKDGAEVTRARVRRGVEEADCAAAKAKLARRKLEIEIAALERGDNGAGAAPRPQRQPRYKPQPTP